MRKLLVPLLLIKENNRKIRGRTKFQKLAFLYQEENKNPLAEFEFIPWDYGPYSKELQKYIDALVDLGLVREKPIEFGSDSSKKIYEYELTKPGWNFVARKNEAKQVQEAQDEIDFLTEKWHEADLEDLLDYVYTRFPSYASRSKLRS